MAFEIVAASRAEEAKTTPWRHAIRTGLALGGAGVFMAVVGILMMFQNRPIIVGILTLGYATLGLTLFAAGLLVARRGLFGHRDPTVVGGVVAGALAAALPALLAVLMSLVDLRSVFVALNPPLLAMLTFGQQPAWLGVAYLLVLGAALGGAGALFLLLADRIRRPLAGGLIATGLAGMLQELIRPILANSRVTKPLHDLLYTWSGLTLRGAVIIFLVAAARRVAVAPQSATDRDGRWRPRPPDPAPYPLGLSRSRSAARRPVPDVRRQFHRPGAAHRRAVHAHGHGAQSRGRAGRAARSGFRRLLCRGRLYHGSAHGRQPLRAGPPVVLAGDADRRARLC